MVKTVSSNGGSEDSIPGWDAEISRASGPKKKKKTQNTNRSNIVTNSVKTLKMIHIKREGQGKGSGERQINLGKWLFLLNKYYGQHDNTHAL